MTDDETRELIRLVREQAGSHATETITLDTRLEAELLLDSLDMTELQMEIEDEFDVPLRDDEWAKVTRASDIVAMIDAMRAST